MANTSTSVRSEHQYKGAAYVLQHNQNTSISESTYHENVENFRIKTDFNVSDQEP